MEKSKKGKRGLKVLLIVVIVIAALIAAGAVYVHGIPLKHQGEKYAEQYRNDESGDCVYFTEDDFGDYESKTYKVKDVKGVFRSVGSVYFVTYSDEQYSEQLQKINAMEFLDADYQQVYSEEEGDSYPVIPTIIPAEKVEEDGWLVRILNNGADNNYPKQIAMIGTNDEEKTIVYMYFTDSDLDLIGEAGGEADLKEFIEQYFSFKF